MKGAATIAPINVAAMSDPKVKILLVDDTPENLVSLEAALTGLGEELVFAHSGREALRQLLQHDFAAILLDVRMPDMDGFQTAELIRSRQRSRQTPILFLTGYRNEEHLFRGYDLGAVDFLFKPIVPEVLRSKVSVFVELSRASAKLQEQADTLRKAELRFRSLLEAAPDAMVVCRADGEIIMVNSQTQAMFGRSRDALVSQNIRRLVPGWTFEFDGAPSRRLNGAKPQPAGRGVELFALREDGSPFPVDISFSPLMTDEGMIVTSAIRDISERKKAEDQIRQLNASLEERVQERTEELLRSNEELQQFAYIASHDLREPLRTTSLYAELLAKRYAARLSADANEIVETIVQNAGRMERLIGDLLDFSKVDSRGADFFTRVNCGAVLDDACLSLRSMIEEAKAEVTRGDLPEVTGDPIQLTRLFQNLLANSIKYRAGEVPRIHISAERTEGEFRFSVRDNGIGIEPQYCEKVFGIFRSLDPRHRGAGNGMGLAICRKIITRHEGHIWVESELGQGTTVHFCLPASA
jgi:PAS domain S-box-containing protein